MANKILTEGEVAAIGGTSTSYENRLCSAKRAGELNCNVTLPSGASDLQLVAGVTPKSIDCTVYGFTDLDPSVAYGGLTGVPLANFNTGYSISMTSNPIWVYNIRLQTVEPYGNMFLCDVENNTGTARTETFTYRSEDGNCEFTSTISQDGAPEHTYVFTATPTSATIPYNGQGGGTITVTSTCDGENTPISAEENAEDFWIESIDEPTDTIPVYLVNYRSNTGTSSPTLTITQNASGRKIYVYITRVNSGSVYAGD